MLRLPSIVTHIVDRVQGKAPSGAKRSPKWPAVRDNHVKENPECAVCGGKVKVEVHHVVPFHVNPELELELSNLITLCESKKGGITCHLFFGHLGSYQRFNPNVKEDSSDWKHKLLAAKTAEKIKEALEKSLIGEDKSEV